MHIPVSPAKRIVSHSQRYASIFLNSLICAALLPNLEKGKTEIMFLLFGAGAKAARRQIASLPNGKLALPSCLAADAAICVVNSYVHVGTKKRP